MSKKATLLTLFLTISVVSAQNTTFCDDPYKEGGNICLDSRPIACIDFWNTQVNCPDGWASVDMTPYIQLIVDTHNKYRNDLAGGNVVNPPLPTAAAMNTVVSLFSLLYRN